MLFSQKRLFYLLKIKILVVLATKNDIESRNIAGIAIPL